MTFRMDAPHNAHIAIPPNTSTPAGHTCPAAQNIIASFRSSTFSPHLCCFLWDLCCVFDVVLLRRALAPRMVRTVVLSRFGFLGCCRSIRVPLPHRTYPRIVHPALIIPYICTSVVIPISLHPSYPCILPASSLPFTSISVVALAHFYSSGHTTRAVPALCSARVLCVFVCRSPTLSRRWSSQ
ncbi:hypothetical protein BKA93DRAFT_137377 [Sparassis latifolia]